MPRRTLTDGQAEDARRRYAEAGGQRGIVAQLAREYGIDRTAMGRLMRGITYREPSTSPRIRRTTAPGLSHTQRAAVVERYDAGKSAEVIAAAFSITRDYVYDL